MIDIKAVKEQAAAEFHKEKAEAAKARLIKQMRVVEKAQAKQIGAVWIGHRRTWACEPDRASEFKRWIIGDTEVFDLMAVPSILPGLKFGQSPL